MSKTVDPIRKWRNEWYYEGTFDFNGKQYPYHPHPHERSVELPIVLDIITERLKGDNKRMLELGNVLYQYEFSAVPHDRDIVDKYDKGIDVINQDIMQYWPDGYKYDLIVSISTIEHIGFNAKIYA